MNLQKARAVLLESSTSEYRDALDKISRGMGWKGENPTERLQWMDDALTNLVLDLVDGRGSMLATAEEIRKGLALKELPTWLLQQLERVAAYGITLRVLDEEEAAESGEARKPEIH